ncbi:MAG: hypothetical protein DRG83_03075 [Deltaproteobacteria bacterium]|nr:MAG: hypothetical protein DRG83_03075 [Deltaproteobacteria bacterium]
MSLTTKQKEVIVYVLAAILMVIRVDWWWWGHKIYPLVFGWLSIPMIYQILVWLAGWLLVAYVVYKVWPRENETE